MKTFGEWLRERDPSLMESVESRRSFLGGLAAAGALAATGCYRGRGEDCEDEEEDDEYRGVLAKEQKLRAAAERVGIPRDQQRNLRGQMVGGIVVVVNGRRVPLTPKEAQHVKAMQEIAKRMGN
jgi:hypothetical protein